MRGPDRICWIDVETTGLDPLFGQFLEVACVVTDWNLKEIASYERLVFPEHNDVRGSVERGVAMPPAVKAMHTQSGLLQAFEDARQLRWTGDDPRVSLVKLREQLGAFVVEHAAGAPLGGSGCHFERKWFDYKAPEVLEALHYRNVDVSVHRTTLERVRPDWYAHLDLEAGKPHRAMADVRQSIAQMQAIVDLLRLAPSPAADAAP